MKITDKDSLIEAQYSVLLKVEELNYLSNNEHSCIERNKIKELAFAALISMNAEGIFQKEENIFFRNILMPKVIFFEKYCDVRTSEAVMILLILCVIYLKIRNALAEKKGTKYKPSILLKCLCLVIPYGLAGFMILTSRFYNPEITWMAKLNTLFSTRLAIGKEAFERYS